ncbi:hypothetical protein ACNAN0_00985 [Agrilactobacillus fermenti]|uniref:hypothetical protein n=1 Tax=Agrilactobacillus fermenti TaxID=2586909 RepID=UPI003A5C0D0B
MAFKHRSGKDETTTQKSPKIDLAKIKAEDNQPQATPTVAASETQANISAEKIRTQLTTASNTDQKIQHQAAAAAPRGHQDSVAQLTSLRQEAEKKVQRLISELDQATFTLKDRLLQEQQALTKITHKLSNNLQTELAGGTNAFDTNNLHQAQQRDLNEYQAKLQQVKTLQATYFNGSTFVRPLSFNPRVSYYILSPDLKADLSEVDRFSLRRLKETFSAHGVTLNAITTAYNADLTHVWASYQDTGLVAPKAKVINMYQDLQTSAMETPVQRVPVPDQPNWIHHIDGNSEVITDQHQTKIMTIRRREDHSLWLITYYFNSQPIKRDIFDTHGQLSATQMIDKKDGQSVTSETFYRDNGSIALVKEYDHDSVQIQLLNEANILMNIFTSEQELISWWLTNRVFKTDSCIVLGLTDPLLAQLSKLHLQHLELLPLVTDKDLGTPAFEALFQGQQTISNILASSVTVNQAVVKYINDLRISTIIPTKATTQPMNVILPKLS